MLRSVRSSRKKNVGALFRCRRIAPLVLAALCGSLREGLALGLGGEIGRASCRERVWIWGVAAASRTNCPPGTSRSARSYDTGGQSRYRRSRFFFPAEDGIRDLTVTGVQTCALPISAVARKMWVPCSGVGESPRSSSPHFADHSGRGLPLVSGERSEERRVGKECGSGGSRQHREQIVHPVQADPHDHTILEDSLDTEGVVFFFQQKTAYEI